jgi:hypothetical protein
VTIALDYDKTYTADPDLWSRFILDATERGHLVICVTGRVPSQPVSIEPPIPVVYASLNSRSGYKRHAAEAAGLKVDVWIDDMPGMIEPTKVLEF